MKNKGKLIAPSVLSADFGHLGEEIEAVEKAGADWIHVDVMDGHFVPNITVGPLVVSALRKLTALPLDVHLMIESPELYIENFARAGANWLSVHQETCPHLDRTITLIRDCGVRPAIVLNPSTPISAIEMVLNRVDMVLLMSVNPGFGGQTFIPYTLDKVRALVELRKERNLHFQIEIDGGIKADNIKAASEAGVDVFVAGSAIFESRDYAETIRKMREGM